ncbi:stage III sporulation protein AA [Clostridium botulinum]|uniref:Stage III sporulation protein AA n=2 Tax=Clostridium botulinum TaxID=1491 RepID=A0A846I6W2_CLOBO|nr:stage III sporulation protein AA [Clostridium botulinum]AJD26193.1 stage III sporulation protein AA [Clostridium botulinum CDC_297]ACQ52554.1 stage III sporulation protein AA [Clostridium botulinum Ba4 str. 657]AJE09806.1 stage III sporulation protein AA [Clostridium botulinum CDC_1436]APR01132.1 stage III sporulation protein AA [Clostridium botulinum]APU60794.1 stage III sporulation protein AA [Clostridium botulinum]
MYTEEILNILPSHISRLICDLDEVDKLQEIRFKIGRPIFFQIGNIEKLASYEVKREDIRSIVQRMSNYSIYSFEEEIKQGYLTIKGGHRVGICGRCVIDEGKVKTIRDISSLNIRICREIYNASKLVMPYIVENGQVLNTIIISPPKCGKTTIIRDISKKISDGVDALSLKGKKVSVIDERSEIAGSYNGVPQLDVGLRTDVLDNCPKSEGIVMAIRSMAPEVMICDEIGTYNDVESILIALNSGVSLITTIHGFGVEDIYNRPVFKEIVENKVFKRAIVLSSKKSVGTLEYVYDFNKKAKLYCRII